MDESIRHSVVRPGNEYNTLRVLLRGGRKLEIYVNGVAIHRPIHLRQPLSPRVMPQHVAWSRHVELTRFRLWLLPPAEPPGSNEGKPPELASRPPDLDDDFSAPD
jgi:hypothetical protein